MAFFPFKKKKESTTEKELGELSYLVDRISLALGEEFVSGNVGKETGFLSKSKTVGVLPSNVVPRYKNKLREAKLEEFILEEEYAGFVNGTAVKKELLNRVAWALDREKIQYRILVNRNDPMPLIITTKNANIIISHMLVKYQ